MTCLLMKHHVLQYIHYTTSYLMHISDTCNVLKINFYSVVLSECVGVHVFQYYQFGQFISEITNGRLTE